MLGKASEVKIDIFNKKEDYEEWCEQHPNATILDFKFQAEFEGSALLVIYKEESTHENIS